MTEAAQKEKRERLPACTAKIVQRGIDPGAIVVIDSSLQSGQERLEVLRIIFAANLDAIRLGEQFQLVTQRTEIFPTRIEALEDARHKRQAPRDGLEVDVVLKQDARDSAKLAGVLTEHGVFQLQHVNSTQEKLAMDQPAQVRISEFPHRMGLQRADGFLPSFHANNVFRRGAEAIELRVGGTLLLKVEQHDQMQFAQAREFAHRLIHEYTAPVDGRTNGIGRNEQNFELGRLGV